MNISEKFNIGRRSFTYQRVDAEYKTNIFLGYNEAGQMSMVITEVAKIQKMTSSKIINVSLRKREDNKIALSFDLVDYHYMDLFLIFCEDIIKTCERVSNDFAIKESIGRWKFWKEMFGKQDSHILEKQEIKGLIGELIVLQELFINEKGSKKAVESWLGPLLGHKDFEVDDTWYEVKAVNENSNQVTISSLEQLESNVLGHLILVRLEETSSVSKLSTNLNKIVLGLLDEIKDIYDLLLFKERIIQTGYIYDDRYNDINYTYKGMEQYKVDDQFPRLRKNMLHPSIGNAKYTILLDGIEGYREESDRGC